MTTTARCLILSCGNTLRSDDGIGPFLSEWARDHYAADKRITVITRHQWTPDLAVDLSEVQAVLFIDCALDLAPGAIRISPVSAQQACGSVGTHHSGAAELLAMAKTYYHRAPQQALLLTIGAGSLELGETFSPQMRSALPEAQKQLQQAVTTLLTTN